VALLVYWLAAQVLGQWEDAGAIMWVAGFLTFEFSFFRLWKEYGAQPAA
jgi:hypothetical protein